MFDGTGWAAAEIVVFMLIATLVGLAIGWILGRWVQRANIGGEYESELEDARSHMQTAEARAGDLQADLERSQLEVKAEQAKLAEVSSKLEEAEGIGADLETVKAELAEKDAEIERLSGELDARSGLEEDLERKAGVLAEKDREIEQLSARLDACQADRTAMEEDLGRVRADLANSASRVAALEADLTTTTAAAPAAALVEDVVVIEADPAASAAEEAVAAETPAGPEPTKEEGLAAIAEIAERTAGAGPRADDDLKKVRGIGPKLERTLKELGITSFRQIANFQPDDIALVTAALDAFKGRIERDDWMSSAAEEHARKYGEPV